ncbi:MAG: nicotinamide riboside transporter PnuC [Phaeodactylibacter sp.]|uniref:nicotinamide riboside transporter PnuC n=1 Tax=Phaeodactylibacter sp. TaxID=1940289 RepID=UPI0032ECCC6A
MMDQIIAEAVALSWVDWVATVTALLYIILAARGNVWCWFWGIISCALWAYASYAFYQLYLDAVLQVFYVVMAFVGLYNWRWGGEGNTEAPIQRLPWNAHLPYLAGGTLLAIAFGYFFDQYTPAAATYWDAFTTVFSVLATLLLVQRYLDNWAYWVVIDTIYIGLYFSREAYLFSLLMVVYTVIASVAWVQWQKSWKNSQSHEQIKNSVSL